MNIKKSLKEYIQLGHFFYPDYKRDNKVLSKFKNIYPELSSEQCAELIKILNSNDWEEKYFVADLLYLYDKADVSLIKPLIDCTIDYGDPSFNRIFLRPSIAIFGIEKVVRLLSQKFVKGNIETRINISNLIYWLRIDKHNADITILDDIIIKEANKTQNIIELYHYNLSYSSKIHSSIKNIPKGGNELIKIIKGNTELEELLFTKLEWEKK
jgi:hypothetical protein